MSRAHPLLALAVASCTGVATLQPIGVLTVSDAPLCPFEAAASTPSAAWSRTGPPGASVQAVLALGQGTLLVGTGMSQSSGLLYTEGSAIFRSSDHGQTVTRVASFQRTQVNQLVVAADGTVYAAVGSLSGSTDDGVWVSEDRGVTFTRSINGLQANPRVFALATSGSRTFALVRGTEQVPLSAAVALFRRDGQGDWTRATMSGTNPVPGGPLGALATDPNQPDRVYAADGARFYLSTDGGETFSTVASTTALGSPRGLLVLAAGHLVLHTLSGVFESTDDGATWKTRLDASVPATSVAASGAALLAGTVGAGLQRLEATTSKTVGKCLLDAVVLAVAVAPDDAQRVWVGVNGGLYASTNGGESFAPAGDGLDEALGRVTVATFEGAPTAFVLSSAGLFTFSSAQARWERRGDWVSTVAFADVAVSSDGRAAYLGIDEELFPGRYGVAGAAWEWNLTAHTVSPVRELEGNVASARFDPSQSGRVFLYQRGSPDLPRISTGVFVRSGDRFSATSLLSETPLAGTVTFRFSPLAVAPDGTVYAGARRGDASPALLRSVDSGATKKEVWSSAEWIAHGVFTDSAGNVYLTGTTGDAALRRSTDRGETFTPFDDGITGLGRITYTLAFDGQGGLIAGTQGGVFYAADGVHFTALNDGFESPPAVWSLAVLPGGPKPVLVAGTSRGLFWRELP